MLNAVANELTGETVGDTSEFSVTAEALEGRRRFAGRVTSIEVRGMSFQEVAMSYPDDAGEKTP